MNHGIVRLLRTALIAGFIAAAGAWGLAALWIAIGGGPLSLHGWIAITLGVLGTVGLAWALMSLAFRSDRDGWDERADKSPNGGEEDGDG